MDNENYNRRYLLQALEFEPQIRRCLLRYTRDKNDVADLLHDTWVRLLKAGTRGEDPIGSIKAYACRVANNLGRDWIRRRRIVHIDPVEDIEQLDVRVDEASPERIVSGHQELERLILAAATMPRRRREVFVLRKVYGLSSREIAEQLHITEQDVEADLRAAARFIIALSSEESSGEIAEQGKVARKWRIGAATTT